MKQIKFELTFHKLVKSVLNLGSPMRTIHT
jgi:hypothetical protein